MFGGNMHQSLQPTTSAFHADVPFGSTCRGVPPPRGPARSQRDDGLSCAGSAEKRSSAKCGGTYGMANQMRQRCTGRQNEEPGDRRWIAQKARPAVYRIVIHEPTLRRVLAVRRVEHALQ